MARARYTIVRVPVSSLEEAYEIIGRMTGLGFARTSMNVTPHDDDTFHVAVHTLEADRARVMQALNRGGTAVAGKRSAATLMLIAGGAAALGAGLWALRSTKAWPRLSGREPGGGDQPFRLLGDENEPGRDGLGSGRFTSAEQSQSNIGAHPGGYTGAARRAGAAGQTGSHDQASETGARGAATSGSSPNTGFSSLDPPRAPSGLHSSLQPGGTVPGGGPGASVGSLGTGGGQTGSSDTGSLKRDGQ